MSEAVQPLEKKTAWRIWRYWFFAFATAVAVGLPFIRVNENHFFLLSFDKMELHLAFVKFSMQEMYLMPFVLMILFIGIFGLTVLGGRVFCGWACPQTIFRVIYRDLIETKLLGLRKRIKNKQQEPDMSKPGNVVKKVVAVLIWTGLSILAAADFMWYFVPPEDFFAYMQNPGEHMIIVVTMAIVAGFLIWDIVFIKENFCVYVCPYSRVQSVLYDEDTVMAIYDPNRGGEIYDDNKEKQFTKQKDLQAVEPNAECTTCESCVTVCPTHIDIRKGLQLECINCLECVDACTTVMGKLGKESLVRWSSEKEVLFQKGKTHYFRPKIIGYAVVLMIVTAIIAVMGGKKEYMMLDIDKDGRPYTISKQADGKVKVENTYSIMFENTQHEAYSYNMELIVPEQYKGEVSLKIENGFTFPVKVDGGKTKKRTISLSTTDMLVEADKYTAIPLTIRTYAEEDKEKVVIERPIIFAFPSVKEINEYK